MPKKRELLDASETCDVLNAIQALRERASTPERHLTLTRLWIKLCGADVIEFHKSEERTPTK